MKDYYRKATLQDIDEVMRAVEDSREFLKAQGNNQWMNGYPNRDDFINDINNGRLFVVFDQDDPTILVGVCALTYHEDDYQNLYEGKWLTDLPYMVMHRVALKMEYRGHGYGKRLFDVFVEQAKIEGYRSLRIDTHERNDVMRHLISSYGFVSCGKAILTPNKDRMVFERVLKDEEMLRLELPSNKYIDDYRQAYEDDELYSKDTEHLFSEVEGFLEKCEQYRLGINMPANRVPCTTLWLVDDKRFYGELHLRHKLNEKLLNRGGHIGYEIRYSKRGHGYGKLMLKLGLNYCLNVLNLRKTMITCDSENKASENTMKSCGGVFGEMVPDEDNPGRFIKKYWINTSSTIIECDRFYLREYQESDYQALSEIYQDAENMKFFGAPYDDKKMHRLMDWTFDNYKKYGFGFWAIIDKSSGQLVGDCGLSMQHIDGEWLPEIGYHLNKKYHHMGYASQAAQLVKEYIFKNYYFDTLYSYTFENHLDSIKVMQRNGMSFVKKYQDGDDTLVVYAVKRDN